MGQAILSELVTQYAEEGVIACLVILVHVFDSKCMYSLFVQPSGAKGNRVNIPDPALWKFPRKKGRGGNAIELGDDGGSSWKSSLFFVRSVSPGKLS